MLAFVFAALLAACGSQFAQDDASTPLPDAEIEASLDASDAGDAACTREAGCATFVAAGRHVACATRADGLFCWGSTQYGALGPNPPTIDPSDPWTNEHYNRPTPITGVPASVVQIAIGDESVCALASDGQVWCWGRNGYGELGHDPGMDSTCATIDGGDPAPCDPTPVPVDGITPASHIVEIAAGVHAMCARSDSGNVFCWGSNQSGAAGQPLAQTSVVSATQVSSSALDGHAKQLAMSLHEAFACALRDDGSVWCWGDDRTGHLGRSRGTLDACDGGCTSTPTYVRESDGGMMTGAVRIAIGGSSACAQTANDVRCWGSNELAGLARASWDSDDHPSPTTAQVPSGTVALVGGAETYIARDALGRLLLWGRNDEGQIGTGDRSGGDTTQPQPCNQFSWGSPYAPGSCFGRPHLLGQAFGFVAIGDEFVTAIDDAGAVWAWGTDSTCETGHVPQLMCNANVYPPTFCDPVAKIVF